MNVYLKRIGQLIASIFFLGNAAIALAATVTSDPNVMLYYKYSDGTSEFSDQQKGLTDSTHFTYKVLHAMWDGPGDSCTVHVLTTPSWAIYSSTSDTTLWRGVVTFEFTDRNLNRCLVNDRYFFSDTFYAVTVIPTCDEYFVDYPNGTCVDNVPDITGVEAPFEAEDNYVYVAVVSADDADLHDATKSESISWYFNKLYIPDQTNENCPPIDGGWIHVYKAGNFKATVQGTPSTCDASSDPYVVEIIAQDSWGESDSYYLYITVVHTNKTPTARLQGSSGLARTPGGAYAAWKGATIEFDGSESSDPEMTSLRYEWNVDGSVSLSPASTITRRFTTLGLHTVKLRVVDIDDTYSPEESTTVDVVGFDPHLNLGSADQCKKTDPTVNGTDPINSATGNVFEVETDYVGSTPVPLEFRRYYNSMTSTKGAVVGPAKWRRSYAGPSGLGANWRHSYDRRIQQVTLDGQSMALVSRPEGNDVTYTLNNGRWDPRSKNIIETLVGTTGSGWTYTLANDDIEQYDGQGRLVSITNLAGQATTLTYYPDSANAYPDTNGDGKPDKPIGFNAGSLLSVTDPWGYRLKFYYADVGGYLEAIALPGAVDLSMPINGNWLITQDGYIFFNHPVYVSNVPPEHNDNVEWVVYPDKGGVGYGYRDSRFKGALTSITRGDYLVSDWTYDAKGRADSNTSYKTNATIAAKITLQYNSDGTTTLTDAKRKVRTYGFSNQEGQLKIANVDSVCTVCGGDISNTTFDANGFVDTQTNFGGVITDYDYNLRGLPDKITEAKGTAQEKITSYTWHANYRLPLCIVTPLNTTSFEYYTNGQLKTKTLIDTSDSSLFGSVAAKTCAAISPRTDLPAAAKRQWSYTYWNTADKRNHQIQSIDGPRTDVPDVINFSYDFTDGLLKRTTLTGSVNDQVTDYFDRDGHGRPKVVTEPSGNYLTTVLAYNYRGEPVTKTSGIQDPLTLAHVGTWETTYFYYCKFMWCDSGPRNGRREAYWNVDKIVYPDQSARLFSYDNSGRLTDVYKAYAYNSFDNGYTHYDLDEIGNRTAIYGYDPDGTLKYSHSNEFNTDNRLSRSLGAPGANQFTMNYLEYDAIGNLKHTQDAASRDTFFDYDAFNRVKKVTDALQHTQIYDYDVNGNRTYVQDPNGFETTYVYDGLSNLKTLKSPDQGVNLATGVTDKMDYDAAGNVTTKTDARNKVTKYRYDTTNKLTSITYNDATVASFTYGTGNAQGKLRLLTDKTATTTWGYDEFHRVITKTQQIGTVSKNFTLNRGRGGRVESLIYPSGNTVYFDHSSDINGNTEETRSIRIVPPSTSTFVSPIIANITYSPLGDVENWTWKYTWFDRDAQRARDLDGRLETAGLGDEKVKINYYNTGNVSGVTNLANAAKNQAYDYDKVDRLTNFTSLSNSAIYAYDNNGNRDNVTVNGTLYDYALNTSNNRVNSVQGPVAKSYGYDGAGNITSDGSHSYTYDDAGRINNIDNGKVTYGINGLGQRISKQGTIMTGDANSDGKLDALDIAEVANLILSSASAASNTDCNGDKKLDVRDVICIKNKIASGEQPSADALKTMFFYDDSGHLIGEYDGAGKVIQEYVWLNDIPVVVMRGAQNFYIHTDQINTPRVITRGADGVVVWRWESDPFGNTAATEDADGDGIAFNFNLRFPGQYYDKESGLNYNWNRYYDPATGRYTQSDPIGQLGGLNVYAYVGSNPNSHIDPVGLDAIYINYDYYPVSTPIGKLPLGHGGVVAVDPSTGNTKYYEFGRYGDSKGVVRGSPNIKVPNVVIGKDGLPTQDSLDVLYSFLSQNLGHGVNVTATYYSNSDYQGTIKYAEQFAGNHPDYNLITNNCKTFGQAAATACQEGSDCK